MNYFWAYDPAKTPKPVVYPADLPESEKVAIACTQTRLTPARQKKLVAEWCDRLPSAAGVRQLWLTSKVPQVLFDAVCSMPSLEALWIKWSGIRSLERIGQLDRLTHFHLGSSTQLESIRPLAGRGGLACLGLENLAKVDDLGPVGDLPNLEGLTLEGSMWTPWRVKSLQPIAGLRRLAYLSLANLRADDASLTPLFGLTSLETFVAAEWWDAAELAEVRRRNPKLTRPASA